MDVGKTGTGHLLMFKIVILTSIFAYQVSLASESNQTTNTLSSDQTEVSINSYGLEFYSELLHRSESKSSALESRLRWSKPILLRGESSSIYLGTYVGAVLERELNTSVSGQYLSNAVRPQLGLYSQPFEFVQAWIEYSQRFEEKGDEQKSSSDPRVGLAIGKDFYFQPRWKLQVYTETVSVFRVVREPVTTSFSRFFYSLLSHKTFFVDPYLEIYGASSPHPDLGTSRSELRAGSKMGFTEGAWQLSVFAYRPWTLRSSVANSNDFEALAVVGGSF